MPQRSAPAALRTAPGATRDGEAGFVLPALIAVLLVVAAAAAGGVRAVHLYGTAAAERAATVRLQGLADAAVRLVAVSLVIQHGRQRPGLGLPENGTPVACPLVEGGTLLLRVQDQAGLIDLNASPRPVLEDAFRGLGVPDHEAAVIAAEVVDARDPDDEPEPNGAEAPQYRARGLPTGPRNAPLGSVDEIDGLPSMTETVAAMLRPALTVHNPGGGIDPALTPAGLFSGAFEASGQRRFVRSSPHQSYAITAVASAPQGARAGRSAILSINAQGTRTGLVAWRYATETVPGVAHPACGAILAAFSGTDAAP